MWTLLKIFGVVSGISILLAVGVLFAGRQAPPQNQWLVYEEVSNSNSISRFRMQPDGSEKQAIEQPNHSLGDGTVHHGKRIVCDETRNKRYWATRSGRPIRPFFDLHCYDYFRFSPDDEWVYLVEKGPGYGATLYRVRLDSGQRQDVYSDSDDQGLSIAGWSPDQAWVYIRTARNDEEIDGQIGRMRPDGTDFQMLTPSRIFSGIIAWSPDKAWLILDSYGSGLYRMRPDGGQLENVTNGFDDTWLGWTDNNETVLFEDQNHLWQMIWATGERRLLSPYKLTDYERPQLSPDGQWILYETYNEEILPYTGNLGTDWRLVSIDGWRDIRLTFDPAFEHSPVWSPDSQWLYFGVTWHGHFPPSMYRIRLDGTDKQGLSGQAAPIQWIKTPDLNWQPTSLVLIGLAVWGIGAIAPFLRRRHVSVL